MTYCDIIDFLKMEGMDAEPSSSQHVETVDSELRELKANVKEVENNIKEVERKITGMWLASLELKCVSSQMLTTK